MRRVIVFVAKKKTYDVTATSVPTVETYTRRQVVKRRWLYMLLALRVDQSGELIGMEMSLALRYYEQ